MRQIFAQVSRTKKGVNGTNGVCGPGVAARSSSVVLSAFSYPLCLTTGFAMSVPQHAAITEAVKWPLHDNSLPVSSGTFVTVVFMCRLLFT